MIYPKTAKGSFFILYSDGNTGHILNRDLSLNISTDEDYFDVFNNLEDAIAYAKSKVNDYKELEILIYNDSNEFITIITKK